MVSVECDDKDEKQFTRSVVQVSPCGTYMTLTSLSKTGANLAVFQNRYRYAQDYTMHALGHIVNPVIEHTARGWIQSPRRKMEKEKTYAKDAAKRS